MMTNPIFNFNLGILGHVDSGKTSLAKALSTTASTASFDKNPQSRERGITLDLGFSSFVVDVPPALIHRDPSFAAYQKLQFTLVDCPGHASLIRTVIGGAQIIDLVLLVVDCQKGVQTQTAECLILAEITCPGRMIVVLNKIDLFEESIRRSQIDRISKKLRKTLENTTFKDSPIVSTSAVQSQSQNNGQQHRTVQDLIACIIDNTYMPKRSKDGPFLYAVDHCFGIKGQGTVMTGTVLSGRLKLNDSLEIPSLKETKKVKSMQIFRSPVEEIGQGDRAGVCVTQFDAKSFERGLVCKPGVLQPTYAIIVRVQKIRYYKSRLEMKMKFHVSVGHETVMCRCAFFACFGDSASNGCGCSEDSIDFTREFRHVESINDQNSDNSDEQERLDKSHVFALLEFDQPIFCPPHALYIASKLDTDIHANLCRLAFYGHSLHSFTDKNYNNHQNSAGSLSGIKVFKTKQRTGMVERMVDDYTLIATGLFKKETNIDAFIGLKVQLSSGESGAIEGHFGQSGKAKIRILTGLRPETAEILSARAQARKKKKPASEPEESTATADFIPIKVILQFKRYIYDVKKTMVQ